MRLIDADALKEVLKNAPVDSKEKVHIIAINNAVDNAPTVQDDDQRQILDWCSSLEEAKLNGEFEHKPEDSYFLTWVKTIAQLATMDIKG